MTTTRFGWTLPDSLLECIKVLLHSKPCRISCNCIWDALAEAFNLCLQLSNVRDSPKDTVELSFQRVTSTRATVIEILHLEPDFVDFSCIVWCHRLKSIAGWDRLG